MICGKVYAENREEGIPLRPDVHRGEGGNVRSRPYPLFISTQLIYSSLIILYGESLRGDKYGQKNATKTNPSEEMDMSHTNRGMRFSCSRGGICCRMGYAELFQSGRG